MKSGKPWFKFVMCEPEDITEVEDLFSTRSLPRDRVLLMLEGTDAETLSARGKRSSASNTVSDSNFTSIFSCLETRGGVDAEGQGHPLRS